MIRQYELVERVKAYDPELNEAQLNRAYVFSMKAHGSQVRASGDPYFSHPLEVAGILTKMKLDSDTIVTALLHDVVEDTVSTIDEIEGLFGSKIAELVDGVTKLSRIEMQTESQRQAENFRKFVLAMSNDIRVLLVKLADRLHNMRTLHYIKKPEKRRRIARETLDIYAPLAERVGLRWMKDELEELAFAQLEPEGFESITTRLAYLREQGGDLIGRIIEELRKTVSTYGLQAEISGREKRPFGIWKKMQERHVPFESMSDVMAFRLVVDDIAQCYQALGIVHARWPMVPGRFKDYISTPKRNGYRSLHTTVIGPQRMRIEIQIRSRDMHAVAEHGVAAHWSYKQSNDHAPLADSERYRWLRDLLDILENASSPEEFLEHTKIAMFQDTVFSFTPKGELITMPKGSSMIDFAYAVHTEVGNRCVGAKVNGRMVPLHQRIATGDQIEILTQDDQTPSPRWETFAITAKARSAIRRFVRQREQSEYAQLGRTLLTRLCEVEGVDLSADAVGTAAKALGLAGPTDLYVAIGRGDKTEAEAIRAAFPSIQLSSDRRPSTARRIDWQRKGQAGDGAIPIKGLTPGMAVHLSECCHPLPGDRIVGVLSPGQGVLVHTIDCEALEAFNDVPERWVDVAWTNGSDSLGFFTGRLKLVVLNESGVLATVANMCARHEGNISNLKITDRAPDFFTIMLDVEVSDVRHLHSIISALRANRVISSAERLRG
ncbi:bifunctional (p)ppGpp synthetase/guanosine-3',5'-bis(diphosphate) 3'-pyrophosphohydrolase [Rhodothalassium salexigens]|uniref:RelA/SpoT family protein n=1 Tax=Rhodothalassium salexigens TaxID=1086 RepID=UPI0019135E0B|nr:bifunctional (p)ppGpp synthetase/guanosine-3',5'-bis(diphosphate) 3'-pyrophosphohydrolase [Rhodothalassium salexigens]MBK5920269.1 bifunctional (p)ppGpp synthetase/guanosine-3',5'-bis(diphosphate) 3'-pyrophosphohydrolase [Rhodothalassium salexigens]